jgi:hypothetical protein
MADREPFPAGRCCVFQPFDKGPFDKRFDDTIAPAIKDAGLEPYRIDRDPAVTIPIEALHAEIRMATICLADISTRNPNVMYELGFAMASGKDVVLISGVNAEKFPFDIQHRQVILYTPESKSDFEKLREDIHKKLCALLERQETTAALSSASPVKQTAGLKPHEFAALALLMGRTDGPGDGVFAGQLKEDMRKAGYTDVATRVAIRTLLNKNLIKTYFSRDDNGDPYSMVEITAEGENWLVENDDQLNLRLPVSEDVPL